MSRIFLIGMLFFLIKKKTICLLDLNIYFNSFIAGNNFICDNIPECVENFAGFNYEYHESGVPKFVSQNCSSCDDGYTEINNISKNKTDDNELKWKVINIAKTRIENNNKSPSLI